MSSRQGVTNYTRDDIERLLSMIAREASPEECAAELHRSVGSIKVKAHQLGVGFRRARRFLIVQNLDLDERAAIFEQAFARGLPIERYVGLLLRVIAKDNLFAAILDDGAEQRAIASEPRVV